MSLEMLSTPGEARVHLLALPVNSVLETETQGAEVAPRPSQAECVRMETSEFVTWFWLCVFHI